MHISKKGYSIFLSALFVIASFMFLTGCPSPDNDHKSAVDTTVVKADTIKAADTVSPAQGKDTSVFKKNKLDSDTGKGVVHPH